MNNTSDRNYLKVLHKLWITQLIEIIWKFHINYELTQLIEIIWKSYINYELTSLIVFIKNSCNKYELTLSTGIISKVSHKLWLIHLIEIIGKSCINCDKHY